MHARGLAMYAAAGTRSAGLGQSQLGEPPGGRTPQLSRMLLRMIPIFAGPNVHEVLELGGAATGTSLAHTFSRHQPIIHTIKKFTIISTAPSKTQELHRTVGWLLKIVV